MLFWTELRTYFSLCVFNAELCGTRARPQHLLHSLQSSSPSPGLDLPSPKHLQRGKRRAQKQDCKVFSLLEKGRDAGGSRGSCKKLSITGKPGFGALLKHLQFGHTAPCNRASKMFEQTGRSPSRAIQHQITDSLLAQEALQL